jgi:hypothetical protein
VILQALPWHEMQDYFVHLIVLVVFQSVLVYYWDVPFFVEQKLEQLAVGYLRESFHL